MSNSDDMNLNVQDYDQEDLLTLLNIQDKEPINYDDIVNASQPYIEKYTSEDNYDLANFFQQIQNQLLEDIDYDEPENIQKQESSQLGNLWQNQNVSQQQTAPTQADRVTDRKQQVQVFNQNDNFVMNRNQLGISNNYQLPVAQGQLNPNLKNTTTRVINIDSQYRENIIPYTSNPDGPSSATNFTLDLSDPIHNAIEIKMTSYQIPFSWYLIDGPYKSNNCFYVCKKDTTDCSMIDISSGNYTQVELVDAVSTSLSDVSGLDISYNPVNGKSFITNTSSTDSYTITFYDPNGTKSCNSSCGSTQKFNTNLGWILGFRGNTSISDNEPLYGQMIYDISGNSTIYSESLVDVFGSKYFLLMLDDYQQNHLNKGLVGITPSQKNVEIPSYWNANLQLALDSSGGIACTPPNNPVGSSSTPIPTFVQNAPRQLTQAQLYTLNSTTQARAQTQRNRLTAPTTSNVLALIPLKGANSLNVGSVLIDDFNLDDAERVYFGPVDLERFRVRLVDDQGYTLNLNGNNWSFTMVATSLYQY
jgi:hypothetical protein